MEIFIYAILKLLGAIIFLIFFWWIVFDFLLPKISKISNENAPKKKIIKMINFDDFQKSLESSIKVTSSSLPNNIDEDSSSFKIVCSCGHESILPKEIGGVDLTIKNINQFYRKFICSSCGERRVNIFFESEKILDLHDIKLCELCKNPIPLSRLESITGAITCVMCQSDLEEEEEINKKLKGRRLI